MSEDTVAGYRILRKLGSGSRAEVYLGHSAALAAAGHDAGAALKCFRTDTQPTSIEAELRVLSEVEHPHVVQLRDVSRTGGGAPTLIFERLERGSLAHLLAARGELAAGEAVTLLAPLAAALGAVHAGGRVHGALSARNVLFRASGAPVLCGFGRSATADRAAIERDNRAMAALTAGVLDRVIGARGVGEWLSSLTHFPDTVLDQLCDRLFGLAEATPVRFAAETADDLAIPARVLPPVEPPPEVEPLSWAKPLSRVEPVETPTLHTRAKPLSRVEPVETPTLQARAKHLLLPLILRIPPRFRSPKYAAVAAGVVALLVAIAVVPTSRDGSAALVPTPAPTVAAAGPTVEDDPVAAFGDLVRVRNQCIRDLSILCLTTVLQDNSAAMDDDVALIESIGRGDGGPSTLSPLGVTIAERMGDAVLLRYHLGAESKPASALIVRGEAGWRIRTYF